MITSIRHLILRPPQRTTYWNVMFVLIVVSFAGLLVFGMVFPAVILWAVAHLRAMTIGLFVLYLSMLCSTASEVLPLAWRSISIGLRIISGLTMLLAFGWVLVGMFAL